MKSMTLNAYAKINLHLDVVSKAENGYHQVNTVMQSVSLCDTVSVTFCDGNEIKLTCNIVDLPVDSRNLAYKAAELFFARVGVSRGVCIDIVKRIPMAAGLAGGSTDAAAVLYALNSLYDEPLCNEELLALGSKIGADVPFCIACGTKYADGFGDLLHSFPPMPECYIVVACGGDGVSTPWAYAALDNRYENFALDKYMPRSLDALRDAMKKSSLLDISKSIYNIFEGVIAPERPMVDVIKNTLADHGALSAMMSGSGPSVFGIFDLKENAEAAVKTLVDNGVSAFVCQPTSERF